MVVAGAIPLQRPNDRFRKGRVPASGWRLKCNDWEGILPFERKTRARFGPAGGAVANANNRTTDAPFPRHVSFDWARPYRIARLEQGNRCPGFPFPRWVRGAPE